MKSGAILTALISLMAPPLLAGEAWDAVKSELYGERPLLDGAKVIAIDAPYRTDNDARTEIAAHIAAPQGMQLGKVIVVLDENPMPVSAVFDLKVPQKQFFFDLTMRVNGPSPLHVIAETTDGQLWVAESFVKTSGQGACAAPPGTDPKEALKTLGQMELEVGSGFPAFKGQSLAELALRSRKLDVDIKHPSHSGMQMDQITLLYIPMRYVQDLKIDLDGAGYVDMTGSITLSENPRVGVSIPAKTQTVDVTLTDTDGTVSEAHKKLAGY